MALTVEFGSGPRGLALNRTFSLVLTNTHVHGVEVNHSVCPTRRTLVVLTLLFICILWCQYSNRRRSTLMLTDKSSSSTKEPVLENLLRNANVAEAVTCALRINEVTGCEVFATLDSTEDGVKTNAADFGIDLRSLQLGNKPKYRRIRRCRRMPLLGCTKRLSQSCFATRPASQISSKTQYGADMSDEVIPAQNVLRGFPRTFGRRDDGSGNTVPSCKPGGGGQAGSATSRQYGIQVDSRLTVTAECLHFSHMPKDIEELKRKFQMMSNLRLFSQMRELGRPKFSDLENTFRQFVEKLTDKRNFRATKELANAEEPIVPQRNHCVT